MKKYIITALVLSGCGSEVPSDIGQQQIAKNVPASVSTEQVTEVVCADLQETDIRKGVKFRKCDGTEAVGTYEIVAQEMPDLTNLRPEHIKKDVEVAGVVGTYEAPSVDMPDLTNLTSGNIRKDVIINGITGTYDAQGPDLSNLTSSNILSGVTIAGVTGTVQPKPALCTGDAQVGCVTTNSFKSVVIPDSSKILLGTTIAGIAGTVRVPDVANVRHGTMVGVNLLGTLNASCRSGNVYSDGTAIETVTDIRDIGGLDDRYNSCRSITSDALSTIDNFSGLRIYNPVNRLSGNYTAAAAFCAGLSYNGLSGWRVPTQKELMQLYINGLRYSFTENTTQVLSSTKLSPTSTSVWTMNPTTGQSASIYVDNAAPSTYFCVR